jgi:hypothetical protein
MIHLVILAVHLLSTIAKLVRPGGVRTVVAESLVLKQQLLISSRSRRRAPNLNSFDRFVLGLGSLFVPPSRIPKLAVILKPRTLLRCPRCLIDGAGGFFAGADTAGRILDSSRSAKFVHVVRAWCPGHAGRNRNLDLVRIFVIDPLRRHLALAARHRRLQFSAKTVADGP